MSKRLVHAGAGTLALTIILAFWSATLVSETLGQVNLVVAVKTAIPWGLLLLIPALMVAGGSGFALAGQASDPLVAAKRRRMPIIAANGLAILVPSALFLPIPRHSAIESTIIRPGIPRRSGHPLHGHSAGAVGAKRRRSSVVTSSPR